MLTTCHVSKCEDTAVMCVRTEMQGIVFARTTVEWRTFPENTVDTEREFYCGDHAGVYLHSLADSQVGLMRQHRRELRE